MSLKVGQRVVSLRVGAVGKFEGEIISIVQNFKNERFAVVADKAGRSWYRDFHELKPLEVKRRKTAAK